MESNNELKEIDIKNCTCYYFHDIMKLEDFDFDNILLDQRGYENNLVYVISYKNLIAAKPFLIKFNKIDGFIRVYEEKRYLVLFDSIPLFESIQYGTIYNRIRYLISQKKGMLFLIILEESKLIYMTLYL